MSLAGGRRAGILLHPTSLPGPFGVGDLGPAAELFLEYLELAGQRVWQVLPLGPPAWAGSPYGALSAFAGNPLLISPERLFEDGLLARADFLPLPRFAAGKVNFGRAAAYKEKLLRRAFERWRAGHGSIPAGESEAFRRAPEQQAWLGDWAIFAAMKAQHGGKPFWQWKKDLAHRKPAAMTREVARLGAEIDYQIFLQTVFDRQWQRLRRDAAGRGIALLGDVPIYVAHDSADVWAHRELFDLDAQLSPRHVAGVPPDYFSKDGQLWGNPLYDWARMKNDGFRWWKDRLRSGLRLADVLRLDHFRGFAGYWQVRAGEKTARHGEWRPGPGKALFAALRAELGGLPLLAEDLGEITPDVDQLRDEFGLPGMRVLQFGFGAEPGIHSPQSLVRNVAVYTGTHDNDTTAGWYRKLKRDDKTRFRRQTGATAKDPAWAMLRTAYASPAELALAPMQDVLGLGNTARMNKPGIARGNWTWRLKKTEIRRETAERLRRLAAASGRI